MAKTRQERVEAALSKEFYEGAWKFRGTQFMRATSVADGGAFVIVHFICGFMWVKARIMADHHGAEDSVRMFTGETAAEDCIAWTASRACEVLDTVAERCAPYAAGMRAYNKALRGE